VREVSVESFANVAECRRYVPTGSRIAVERCTPKNDGDSAAARAEQELLRQDVESMRRQQMYQEQIQRQAEALRRAGDPR
jgi:hypothetical protein